MGLKSTRIWLSCCLALLCLACSSGNDDGGGLLNGGVGGSGSGTSGAATLTVTGPATVATGIDTGGFQARLFVGSQAVQNGSLRLVASAGTVSVVDATGAEQKGIGEGLTSANGLLNFYYQSPPNLTMATPVTITATAPGFVDATGRTLTRTFQFTVQPDTFRFTSPAPNALLFVGSANTTPLRFQWTRASSGGSTGVAGSVTLNASNGATLLVNGSPVNAGQAATVLTDASGGFQQAVSIYNNTRGFTTVNALDGSGLTAALTLQFDDAPSQSALTANPYALPVQTGQQSSSRLTFTVANASNTGVKGVDVTFTLTQPAGGDNELLFPAGGTTNDQGVATSTYYSGTQAGTARITACVSGGSLCQVVAITVGGSGGGSTGSTGSSTGGSTPAASLAVSGPVDSTGTTILGPHQYYSGFRAVLTDGSGASLANTFVSLNANGGNIAAPPGSPNTGGATTDANGAVTFAYLNDNPITSDTPVTVTATASANNQNVTSTYRIVVRPDAFAFTAPAASSQIKSGNATTAVPVAFNWTRRDPAGSNTPQNGSVTLSTGSAAKFVVSGSDTGSSTTNVTIVNGAFQNSVAVYDPNNEAVTLRAELTGASYSQSVTVPINFIP